MARGATAILLLCAMLGACGQRAAEERDNWQSGMSAEDAADIEQLKSDARNLNDIAVKARQMINESRAEMEARRAEHEAMVRPMDKPPDNAAVMNATGAKD